LSDSSHGFLLGSTITLSILFFGTLGSAIFMITVSGTSKPWGEMGSSQQAFATQ